MSESENAEEEAEAQNEEASEIDFSDLSDEQREALSTHPEVRKMLEYEDTSVPQISGMLKNLIDEEWSEESETTYGILVRGIAERSGRVTESTVNKVLNGFVEEYESVQ
jgi:hypothetical protein